MKKSMEWANVRLYWITDSWNYYLLLRSHILENISIFERKTGTKKKHKGIGIIFGADGKYRTNTATQMCEKHIVKRTDIAYHSNGRMIKTSTNTHIQTIALSSDLYNAQYG